MPAAALPRTCVTTCSTRSRRSACEHRRVLEPSLVTRLTTDINNVQRAFMMLIRIAVRLPLVLVLPLPWHTPWAAASPWSTWSSFALGFGLFFIIYKVRPIFARVFRKTTRSTNPLRKTSPACAWSRATCARTTRRRSRHRRARRPDDFTAPRSCSPSTTP
ncbi:MAG: hypothetical protein ACLU0O_04150 [Collinsella sp.]